MKAQIVLAVSLVTAGALGGLIVYLALDLSSLRDCDGDAACAHHCAVTPFSTSIGLR